jgi:hypothetical protein
VALSAPFAPAGPAAAGTVPEAPADVRKTAGAKFVEQPAVSRDGVNFKITFEASPATDAEVAVVDGAGKVLRHLAAGLLGPNAPEPFKKGSLAQELIWDGKDDLGRPVLAEGGKSQGAKVRVRLGSRARLDKYVGWEPKTLAGGVAALLAAPGGELFVMTAETFKFGRAEIFVLDRKGNYLRTIMPYAASTPEGRLESVGRMTVDGKKIPVLYSGHANCVYPMVCGMRGQTMAWHPDGYIVAVSAVGTAREHGPPRHLLAFHPKGGAPERVRFIGPQIIPPRGFLGGGGERYTPGMDRVAVSPDGRYIYLSHCMGPGGFRRMGGKGRKHGIYRMEWSDEQAGKLWLGKHAPGAGGHEFNDPQGIAVDAKGRLFICDRGNNRIKVYSPDGKLLDKFAAELPEQIALHPKTGEIFVLSKGISRKSKTRKLLAFSPWKEGKGSAKLAEVEVPRLRCMTLEPESKPARLWIAAGAGWGRPNNIVPVSFAKGGFRLGEPIATGRGLCTPSFLAADPARNRLIVKEHLLKRRFKPFRAIDLASGKTKVFKISGSDITLDAEGNMYVRDGYSRASFLARYNPEGKPLPFPGTGKHKITATDRTYGPDMGLRGHRVALNGDIYWIRSVAIHGTGACLDVYGSDGKLKKGQLIAGMGSGDCGLGLDAAGNIYVGINVRPADKPLPADFAGQVPGSSWSYWRKKRQTPWDRIYLNPYLFHMGSVFKFGPEGGKIYGNQRRLVSGGREYPIASPGTELEKAPKGAIPFKTSCLRYDVRMVGAKWRCGGVGPIPAASDGPRGDPGCICMPSHLDADLWGRVYAPSAFHFSVEMLDSAGNRIARVGGYGNVDDGARAAGTNGERSSVPGGAGATAIHFAAPQACDYAGGRLFVSDSANKRVAVIRFDWAAAAEAPLP